MTWNDIYLRQGAVQHDPMTVVQLLVERLRQSDAHAPWRILDAGCGTGRHALYAAEVLPNASLHCFDSSPEAIRIFQGKIPSTHQNRFELHVLDLDVAQEKLPENFDAIISTLTIHHGYWSQIESRFRTLSQIIRPRGLLAFACLSDEDPRAKTGYEVEPRTRQDTAQADGDVLHHFSHLADVEHLFDTVGKLTTLHQELVSRPGTTFDGIARYWEVLAQR